MPLAENKPQANASDRSSAGAKIVELRDSLRARSNAVGGWAQQRAGAARSTAEHHPMATAGIAAGIALLGGVALGLILSGQMAGLRQSLKSQDSFSKRARSMLKR